jgi:hypothetical protein
LEDIVVSLVLVDKTANRSSIPTGNSELAMANDEKPYVNPEHEAGT